MTRRQLRAAFNHAHAMWTKTRSHKWYFAMRAANLALMQESTRRARGGGR